MALDKADAALIRGMLLRGDRQQDIAAWFGGDVNSGRISEINTGKKWSAVPAARPENLPPPGPYQIGVRSALKARETLQALRDLIDQTLDEITAWETKSDA